MYQRILVPIDGSPTSERGLSEAIALARLTQGCLRLFHAIDDMSLVGAYEGAAVYAGNLMSAFRAAGEDILAAARRRVLDEGVACDMALVETCAGRVSDLVVEHARSWPADLIVIGTHGRRGIRRALLGSDAEDIVRRASVPVLLLRGADPHAPG